MPRSARPPQVVQVNTEDRDGALLVTITVLAPSADHGGLPPVPPATRVPADVMAALRTWMNQR